jgi:hypothetical protein
MCALPVSLVKGETEMRPKALVVFAVIVTGTLIGCGGKSSTTPATGTPAPATESQPNREVPAGPTPGGIAPTDSKNKLKIEIAKAKVSVNGTTVAIPAEPAVLEKLFGKPSGSIDDPVSDSNKYVYWSEMGIRGSQDKKGKQVFREIDFNFNPTWDLSAKAMSKPFTGELILEGQVITKATSRAELGQKLKIGREAFGSWQINYEEAPLQVTVNPGDMGVASVTVMQPLAAR